MLSSSLTSNILKCNAEIATLLIHLGLRLTDVEHTAAHATTAHATHEQYPYRNDKEDGEHVIEDHVQEVVILFVFKGIVTSEGLGLLGLIDKLLHLFYAAEFHLHVWFRTRLLSTLLEHITYVLRLNVHLQHTLRLVDHNLRGIAMVNHRLKVRI